MRSTALPTPTPEIQAILDRIDLIGDRITTHAAAQEGERKVDQQIIDALEDTGVFQILKPARLGAVKSTIADLLTVTRQVGLYDGGTSWVTTLSVISNYITTLWPGATQDEVFGTRGLNTRLTGVIQPSLPAARVAGGYRVSGKWYYNSGSWYTDWAWLGAPLLNENGDFDGPGIVLVPRADYSIEDTWFTVGMRASASNCIVLEDVFVPDSHVIRLRDVVDGTSPGLQVPDRDATTAATLQPVFALGLIGPVLGAGSAALEFVKNLMDTRDVGHTVYAKQSDSTGHQIELARAATLIDTAHLHAYRAAKMIDDAAAENRQLNAVEIGITRADTGWAAECVVNAINKLIDVHGAGAFAERSPLQRMWRDASVASRHAAILPLTGFEGYGKVLLGRAPITPYEAALYEAQEAALV